MIFLQILFLIAFIIWIFCIIKYFIDEKDLQKNTSKIIVILAAVSFSIIAILSIYFGQILHYGSEEIPIERFPDYYNLQN